MRQLTAVKLALAACAVPEHRESVVLIPCWKNGFFGGDPFRWAPIARAIGATMDEVMSARFKAFYSGEVTKEVGK